jgi:uncharacterized protein (DUF2235 family)
MPKNIAVCADGTWNHPGETERGVPAPTNVYKLFKTLSLTSTQLPHYDDGVGVGGTPIEHLLGGAIGDGLFAKVKENFAFVAHAYDDGDQLFLFGFSRGAYTARSLAGMITACGLPASDKFTDKAVEDAFSAYRARTNRPALIADLNKRYGNRPVEIAMVGVWETVGALGIPGNLFAGLDEHIYGFLDTKLNKSVKAAYHAISIDEKRAEYIPTFWDPLTAEAIQSGNVLEQVWFAGVHSDVGGSYAEAGLSDIALSWMMRKAKSHGLQFDGDSFANYTEIEAKHALDAAHQSWNPLWGLWKKRTVPTAATVANSVAIRARYEDAYRPTNLIIDGTGGLTGYGIENVVPDPLEGSGTSQSPD